MLFAADYPFLDVFWSMIIFFCWVPAGSGWSSRSSATSSAATTRSGFKKAIWCVFIILVPFLGALVYLIANGDGMGERQRERVRQEASPSSPATSSRSPRPTAARRAS